MRNSRSVLPLVGIAALMVFGFVVLMTALTYDPRTKSEKRRDRPSAQARRSPRDRWRRHAQRAFVSGRSAVHGLALTVGGQARRSLFAKLIAVREWTRTHHTRVIEVFEEWWPRLRSHATDTRGRWLSLESTTGQLIAVAGVSVAGAYFIVHLG